MRAVEADPPIPPRVGAKKESNSARSTTAVGIALAARPEERDGIRNVATKKVVAWCRCGECRPTLILPRIEETMLVELCVSTRGLCRESGL